MALASIGARNEEGSTQPTPHEILQPMPWAGAGAGEVAREGWEM
jgi:hypothetical protein